MTACKSTVQESSNAFFVRKIEGTGTIKLTGWAKLSGELLIYSGRESLDGASKFPNCISGVFSNQYGRDLSAYSGKRVTVTAKLFSFSDLPDEDRPAIPRKMLADSVITNWCFGQNVLLLKSIKFAD